MPSTVLILGARGRFGLAAARAFADAGWRVLGLIRAGAQAPTEAANDPRITWLMADLNDAAAVTNAAKGASVVVHALNPPYTNRAWQTQAMPMTEVAIEMTRLLDATLMFMGNIYNFGAHMPSVLTEDTPQRATTVKGQIRVDMEDRIQRSGVNAIVIRAGDFFGSGKGTWFDLAVVKDIQKGIFTYPGPNNVATAWAYLPDLARTFAEVAARRQNLKPFEVFHFAGHGITGQQWRDELTPIAQAQGWIKPDVTLKSRPFPWSLLRIGALFVPAWAALLEMRYLWDTAHALDNSKLVSLLGAEPHTPLTQAATTALHDLGAMSGKNA